MAVSVTMPRLGESVSEGTVTRWLKQEGDQVEADEPLLEVSTDKVDTEIPAPASGVLQSIKVQEDETVEVGVELAVIGDESDSEGTAGGGEQQDADPGAPDEGQQSAEAETDQQPQASEDQSDSDSEEEPEEEPEPEPTDEQPQSQPDEQSESQQDESQQDEQAQQQESEPEPAQAGQSAPQTSSGERASGQRSSGQQSSGGSSNGSASRSSDGEAPYVTPLVRRLAAEHEVDLSSISGTGVGGRIRKQDVLDAAASASTRGSGGREGGTATNEGEAASRQTQDTQPSGSSPAVQQPQAQKSSAPQAEVKAAEPAEAAQHTHVRGHTEKLSRLRTVIARRMVESLHVSAQLTTVVEVDVTRIAKLRARAKDAFVEREGVPLSFLPFFAVAACEALKQHPKVNASIDLDEGTVTYHEAEHLGIAVDTDRGLLVPVIHNAGDYNLGGMARKIADLANRTRSNEVTPEELGGGTFTITNTGSRGALIDTPIINQPQVGILGTGTVVKRPAVVEDPDLGEVIAVRSIIYLSLSYDHRIVDGADAARFLTTVKERLEDGNFEGDLGL